MIGHIDVQDLLDEWDINRSIGHASYDEAVVAEIAQHGVLFYQLYGFYRIKIERQYGFYSINCGEGFDKLQYMDA